MKIRISILVVVFSHVPLNCLKIIIIVSRFPVLQLEKARSVYFALLKLHIVSLNINKFPKFATNFLRDSVYEGKGMFFLNPIFSAAELTEHLKPWFSPQK